MTVQISEREKYLFDIQGYLTVKNVLTKTEVNRINKAVDANLDKLQYEHTYLAGSKALRGSKKRGKLNGMLTWPKPHCQPFRDLIVHKKVLPYLNTLLGRGWHMDHEPIFFYGKKGAEGLALHLGDPHFQGGAYYVYKNGDIRNGLTVFQFILADVEEGDGGFCCIPGSHKTNFLRPWPITRADEDAHLIVNPPAKAGDMIIFTEALAHGTMPWKADHDRRALLYRYTPKFVQYGPGFHTYTFPEWVNELTDAQRAALEPAYFYSRPYINDDMSVTEEWVDAEEPPFRYGQPD